ncbi:MAG: HlyC/CorC family transporter [Alphaproteobacteria bacterium]|nr:HlyC/CorC family transporter [Alphaproteobacteria bacterium]MBU1561147.1 HlyC/CorC family transporter [Alphaproteobacteria bacterium]MBU2302468.1 HlyC/CorC family transporter [Alphaproteobacteria bacterium]MBU2366616.1 HlyC/CorC family transporter [Alphaproteobacteria bacterium]
MLITALAIVALLAMSFFFSGSETALTAASRARIHQLARNDDSRALTVEKLIADKERLIGAILLGNNVVNILASTLAASLLIQIFGEAGIVYATLAMTAAVVVFSEVMPKTLALMRPDSFALAVAPAINIIVVVFAPVTLAVQWLVTAMLRLFGVRASEEDARSGHDELRGTVDYLHAEGGVIKHDADMLGGILDLRDLRVSDVMVHRTQMLTLDIDLPADELVEQVLDSAYTRIPIYEGSPDNIVGLLHAKDVLRALARLNGEARAVDVKTIVYKPWFVPQSTSVHSQLAQFRKRHEHMAIVLDEYGVVEGLVTLEDIIEEIVGEISDEHDEPEDQLLNGIRRLPDGGYSVDASLPVRDVNRAMGWNFPDSRAHTVAGVVIDAAKVIPREGQEIDAHGFHFKVLERDRQRVARVLVRRIQPQDPQG